MKKVVRATGFASVLALVGAFAMPLQASAECKLVSRLATRR